MIKTVEFHCNNMFDNCNWDMSKFESVILEQTFRKRYEFSEIKLIDLRRYTITQDP